MGGGAERERENGRKDTLTQKNGRIFKEKEEKLKEVELEGNRKSSCRLQCSRL